jgi:hypothetical protein
MDLMLLRQSIVGFIATQYAFKKNHSAAIEVPSLGLDFFSREYG